MAKKINIRPTTSVYATYKNIKYDPWTAIAEFVDNSTQSYYDNIKALEDAKYWRGLKVEIFYENDSTCNKLIIRDNAYGMDFRDFQRAIILDSPPKNPTRSEFGMGLKTAACWFGVNWSVESTALGSSVKYKASIDVEALHKYQNEEIEVEEFSCNPKEHGTTITIWNLNRTIAGRQVKKTKDQLRGIYRTDIRSGKISIYYNGESLRFEDPKVLVEELPDNSKKTWREEVDFQVEHGEKSLRVYGFIALRETASVSDAGFSLIRRGRVIVGGYENNYRPEEIFEKSNSFVYQRLFGELNMDDWPVVQTKDAFDWHNGLEDEFINKLNLICADYKKKAKDYRKGRKTSIDPGINNLVETFSKAGIIDKVEIKPLDQSPPQINNVEQTPIIEPTTVTPDNEDDIIIVGENGKKITFETNGTEFTFNLILQKDDPQRHWLYISKRDNEYDIEWNIRHPFFKPYIDDPEFLTIMEKFIFAFALAEIESQNTSVNGKIESSVIRMKMNDMLKNVMRSVD